MNSKWKTPKGRKAAANRRAYQKRKAAAAAPAKVPDKVKAYVKRAIDAEIQDKQEVTVVASTQGALTTGFIRGFGIDNTIANYGLTTINIIPPLPLGTDEDKRIANKVRPKSLVANYVIYAQPIDAVVANNNTPEGIPFLCAVLFYNRKDSRGSSINDILKDYGASNTEFTNINDFLLPFNKETYNILSYKVYKMYPSQKKQVVGTVEQTVGVNSIPGYVPMVMKTQNLPLPATLIYDDATTTPTNARIYCAIGCFNIDNSVANRADVIRARVEMNTVLTYQNA